MHVRTRRVSVSTQIQNILLNIRYAFRPHKPLLTLRLVKTLIGVHLFGTRPLRYVDVAIHYACNLECEHCFATVLDNPKRPRMTLEDYRKMADQAMSEGAVNFSFQGGEPTANIKNLIEIIEQFSPRKNLISVTTNGTLLDDDKVAQLRQAGVDILTVSLDSGIPEEHDAFRRKEGTFDLVMQTVDLAKKHGINVTLGATVCHSNLHSEGTEKLFAMAEEKNLILFLSLAAPAGEWTGANDDILLDEADMIYITELENKHLFVRTDFRANWKHNGCGAIKEILYVTPYGDLFPCPFLHFTIGNVKESSLPAIRKKGCELIHFKNYHPTCLCAEDKGFIKCYMSEISKSTRDGNYITAEELYERVADSSQT